MRGILNKRRAEWRIRPREAHWLRSPSRSASFALPLGTAVKRRVWVNVNASHATGGKCEVPSEHFPWDQIRACSHQASEAHRLKLVLLEVRQTLELLFSRDCRYSEPK